MTLNKHTNDLERRNLSVNTSKVVEILPDYFKTDYPKLITLLETYTTYLDSDNSFNDKLRNVLKSRDFQEVAEKFLNYILKDIGWTISTTDRELARNIPDYFTYKGSLYSIKKFFRAVYGEEIDVSYPKDNIFKVGESLIGPESLRFIQDGKLYQTWSIFIKSSKSFSEWENLYKKFVHPAGFYVGAEVLIEGISNGIETSMPIAILDSNPNMISVSSTGVLTAKAPYDPMTGYYLDSGGPSRIDLERKISITDSNLIAAVNDQYGAIINIATADPTDFSDSSGMDFTNTIETFDRSQTSGT